MKLIYKRGLVLFSVALNVGFVIVALILVYQHSTHSHDHGWRELVAIVGKLDLPAEQSRRVLDDMRQFHSDVEALDRELERARGRVMALLARKGPVDREQLHRLMEAVDERGRRKSERFERHIIELRHLLGDEKGSQFFSLLQRHMQSTHAHSHR